MSAGNTLTLETTKGPVVIEMNPGVAPGHVERIKQLAPRASTTAWCSTG